MEHRKKYHGYRPNPPSHYGRRASRRSAAAPYPCVRYITPEVEIPSSLDLNDLTFPEYAGFHPSGCGSRSPSAEGSDARFSGEFKELSCGRFFDLPAK
jgi:hypothetical protein